MTWTDAHGIAHALLSLDENAKAVFRRVRENVLAKQAAQREHFREMNANPYKQLVQADPPPDPDEMLIMACDPLHLFNRNKLSFADFFGTAVTCLACVADSP